MIQNPFDGETAIPTQKVVIASFSSRLFGGFKTKINVGVDTSLDEIIALAVSGLFTDLEDCRKGGMPFFENMIAIARETTFHVHATLDSVLKSGDVWICDHE